MLGIALSSVAAIIVFFAGNWVLIKKVKSCFFTEGLFPVCPDAPH